MSEGTVLLSRGSALKERGQALLVTLQDPQTRRYDPVGVLSRTLDGTYHFRYLDKARKGDGFRPFLGFSDPNREYTSQHLFPLFAERVLGESRPDRMTLFEALDLVETVGPMEFLARSGGHRAGDTIELLPIPETTERDTSCVFLVHGVGYQPGASEAIEHLAPGQELILEPEPDNEFDPQAVLITNDGTRLGWVPNPLLDYVRAVMRAGEVKVTVVRANPPTLGHHMRLLIRLEGHLQGGYVLPWQDVDT